MDNEKVLESELKQRVYDGDGPTPSNQAQETGFQILNINVEPDPGPQERKSRLSDLKSEGGPTPRLSE